jgi:hypothetical protein
VAVDHDSLTLGSFGQCSAMSCIGENISTTGVKSNQRTAPDIGSSL